MSRQAKGTRRQGLWRKIFILLIAAMSLSFIVNSVLGQKGLLDIYRARRNLETTRLEIQKLRVENEQLRQEIERLETDPAAAEEVARRELGLIRKDEYLIVVDEKRAGAAPGQPK